MNGSRTGRLWIVSEPYYPDEVATGYYMTGIAEGLAVSETVHVLCSQPTYSARGMRAPTLERRNGVEIRRCWGTTWDKDVLWKRLANTFTFCLSIFLRMLVHFRRGDRVLVVTSPPVLPFLTSVACRLRKARCFLLIHDVYPDIAVTAGLLSPHSPITRLLHWLNRRLYLSMERIIVLGRDMRELILEKSCCAPERVVWVPNWADVDEVCPDPRSENRLLSRLGLQDKFVIQYAGNMGPLHNIEALVECAALLRHRTHVHFFVIGGGRKRKWLEEQIADRQLPNVTLSPGRPRSESLDFLNACDIAVQLFVPGVGGLAMPSRTYNVLAAGKPMIAMCDANSELARLVEEEAVGWVVAPNDPRALADTILRAIGEADLRHRMGQRAREVAETEYCRSRIVEAYAGIVGIASSHDRRSNLDEKERRLPERALHGARFL